MKRANGMFLFVLVFCLAVSAAFAAPVQAETPLTMTRAVLINDYQVILEFSEPVAFNLNGSNSGPWISVRVVSDNNNTLIWDGQPDTGTALQWGGSVSFVDETHNRLLFTIVPDKFGVNHISDILHFSGGLAPYSEHLVRMCIEEVPFDQSVPANDGYIDNITTLDGKTMLTANNPDGWCGVYLPLEYDSGYEIDLAKIEPVSPVAEIEGNALWIGGVQEQTVETVKQISVWQTALVLCGGLVVAAGLIAVLRTVRKGGGQG